jgi:hypothetical protein
MPSPEQVIVRRPDAPRDTRVDSSYLGIEKVTCRIGGSTITRIAPRRLPSNEQLASDMLREFRRKVRAEADAMRDYTTDIQLSAHRVPDELRRVLNATADRLDEIIGGAPT